jgi:hypothetical protein
MATVEPPTGQKPTARNSYVPNVPRLSPSRLRAQAQLRRIAWACSFSSGVFGQFEGVHAPTELLAPPGAILVVRHIAYEVALHGTLCKFLFPLAFGASRWLRSLFRSLKLIAPKMNSCCTRKSPWRFLVQRQRVFPIERDVRQEGQIGNLFRKKFPPEWPHSEKERKKKNEIAVGAKDLRKTRPIGMAPSQTLRGS